MNTKDWYSPHSVWRFTKAQVKWAIPYLPLLRAGSYPRNPKETGYTSTGGKPQYKSGAKFEMAAGIAAELDLRIQRAGADGLMLEFLYAFEPEDELFVIEHMAQCLNLERREVYQRIRNALYFVSGEKRKAGSYSQYVRDNSRYLRPKERGRVVNHTPGL